MGVNSEVKTGVTEVGLGIGAGLGAGIETKQVGLMGGNKGACRAREVCLEKLRARKD